MAAEYERQNNSRLEELSSKVTALRQVTTNIYENARDQQILDSNNEVFSNLGSSLKGSATRLTRMAQQGNKVAVLKLAGIIIVAGLILYWLFRLIFRWL